MLVFTPSAASRRSCQFERLETRDMMAAGISVTLTGSTLTFTGAEKADAFNFRLINGRISVADVSGSWDASAIDSIIVDCKGGDDAVSVNSLANGGTAALAENFTIKSGPGTDRVRLADNREAVMTGAGHTFTIAAAGGVGAFKLDGAAWTGPGNWFDLNIRDAALRSLGSSLFRDGQINRSDMIALFRSAEDGDLVDATELADLRLIAGRRELFGSLDHVKQLATYVVTASAANSTFANTALGNLQAGSTGQHLERLIGKWFLGLDRPAASAQYQKFAGQLFVNGASYSDIRQGAIGDCYFLASLAETALRNPAAITNMFIVNGDGTYTVRFFNGGVAHYVTVDAYLPANSSGALIYAGRGTLSTNASGELWTALAEKAYAQINQFGWIRAGLSGSGQNSYAAISGGYIYAALGHITGQGTSPFNPTAGNASFTAFAAAFNAGKSIGFASVQTPPNTSVVGGHAYAVLSYSATAQTVTLYNPWGPEYGTLTLTWAQVQANFAYFDRTV